MSEKTKAGHITWHPIVEADLERIVATPVAWERLKNKTILVTGAAGFLPAYIIETILFLNTTRAFNCRVVGLVRNVEKARKRFNHFGRDVNLEFEIGDVAVARKWSHRFDVIVHAASPASPTAYLKDPVGTLHANFIGCSLLLENAREWETEEFLYFSSAEVYGEVSPSRIPTAECDYGYIDINHVRACYAEGKRAGEILGVSYHRQFGTAFKAVRPFHTFGPGLALDDGRVFCDFIKDIVHRRDIVLRSDGKAVRAFCYLSDAVAGYFTVLLNGKQGVAYNVGNPDGKISIGNLAELLASLFPERQLSVVRQIPDLNAAHPISVSVPVVDRLRGLGWRPQVGLPEGFRRTVDYIETS